MDDYGKLKRFSDLDNVEVAEDDPDVRGWDVVTSDGRDLGEVKDLLVDTSAMKVRCLEVELEGRTFNWNDNRRVAIPVDSVRLDDEHDDVVITGMGLQQIGQLQEYRYSGEGRAADVSQPRASAPERTARPSEGAPERLTRSEEEVRIGKREVEAGEVRVGKHVETEHVNQPVTRTRERVHIERRPASEATAGGTPTLQNDEIRVPVVEEEVIVEKRPVVKEELVIAKDRVEETQNVETDIRKERFDVDQKGKVLEEDAGRPREGRDRLKGDR